MTILLVPPSAIALATPTGVTTAGYPAFAPFSYEGQLNAASGPIVPEPSIEAMSAPKGDRLVAQRPGTEITDKPSFAGSVFAFRLRQPYDAAQLPASAFAAQTFPRAEQVLYARFALPAAASAPTAMARARLPLSRPVILASAMREAPAEPVSPVLSYAPASSALEAPFDAVLGTGTPAVPDGVWLPRPRPDPQPLLGWLDGRSLGQFAPGQHDWVQNPLPAGVHSAKEQKCLAEGIYFEARGEPEEGQAAVAQVILNRVRAPAYPDTICGVVYQNKNWRNRCQFSFACDGRKDRIRSPEAYKVAERIAKDVTEGRIWLESVGDSTHYYANYVSPRWARRMKKMEQVGAHLFYRTFGGGWS